MSDRTGLVADRTDLCGMNLAETQTNSAHVSPTKIQMKTFEITQYKISNSSELKINQIPNIKNSNYKMQSMTDF